VPDSTPLPKALYAMRHFITISIFITLLGGSVSHAQIHDTTVASRPQERIELSVSQAKELGIEPKIVDIESDLGLMELELKRPGQIDSFKFVGAQLLIFQDSVAIASLYSIDSLRESFFYISPMRISSVRVLLNYGQREYSIDYEVSGI